MTNLLYILWNINIILESLPISSSGHLRLLTQYLSRKRTSVSVDRSTEHLMHLPNACVILTLLIMHTQQYITLSLPSIISYGIALCIVNLLTGIAYLTLKKRMQQFPLWIGLVFSALSLLSLYWAPALTSIAILPVHALIIGCAQTLALLPGVSRMALTVTTGIWLGIHPGVSFLFSLACELVLIIVAVAAALYKTNMSWSLTSKQLFLLGCSTLLSYAALELSRISFLSGTAVFFGWYLLLVSIYAKSYQRKEANSA